MSTHPKGRGFVFAKHSRPPTPEKVQENIRLAALMATGRTDDYIRSQTPSLRDLYALLDRIDRMLAGL